MLKALTNKTSRLLKQFFFILWFMFLISECAAKSEKIYNSKNAELDQKPQRIASINICTDQLLILLAKRKHIVSVSYLSRDPAISAAAAIANQIPINNGNIEELLALQPDLVLTSHLSFKPTTALLEKFNIPVLNLPAATTMSETRSQIKHLAEVLGEEKRGAVVLTNFDKRVSHLKSGPKRKLPEAIVYHPNGYTSGKGTLIDSVLKLAGFKNFAKRFGTKGYKHISLELIAMYQPEYFIIEESYREKRSLATELFHHPAILHKSQFRKFILMPMKLWICPNPNLIEAAELLARSKKQ